MDDSSRHHRPKCNARLPGVEGCVAECELRMEAEGFDPQPGDRAQWLDDSGQGLIKERSGRTFSILADGANGPADYDLSEIKPCDPGWVAIPPTYYDLVDVLVKAAVLARDQLKSACSCWDKVSCATCRLRAAVDALEGK